MAGNELVEQFEPEIADLLAKLPDFPGLPFDAGTTWNDSLARSLLAR